MKHTHLLYLFIITAFYSCSYVNEDDLTEVIIVDGLVTYTANIKTIIDNNCISCHSSPPVNGAPMALVTYTDVIAAIENRDVIERISSNDLGFVMPSGGPRLPQNLIDLIIQWQQEGLLEN